MFTNKEREGIDTFVCAVSLYVDEVSSTFQDVDFDGSLLPLFIN